jgi:hypothetical protein
MMSVSKLLSRIVAAEDVYDGKGGIDSSKNPTTNYKAAHDHTYGITSDPMVRTIFVVSISLLFHFVLTTCKFFRHNSL